MKCNTYHKVLMAIIVIQLLGCIALFLVNDKVPLDYSERIVVEYRNSIWLLTARVSCVVPFVTLTALAVIAARRCQCPPR